LVVREGTVQAVENSNLPIGLFDSEEFALTEVLLAPGHGLVIYSDGVSEATDWLGREYGADRIRELIRQKHTLNASSLLAMCRDDLTEFRRNAAKADDVTLFVLARG
jgi:serine phosphatase RsbU (regulator of sigma subunit)